MSTEWTPGLWGSSALLALQSALVGWDGCDGSMFNGLWLFSFPKTPDRGVRMAFLPPCRQPWACNEGSGVPVLKSTRLLVGNG